MKITFCDACRTEIEGQANSVRIRDGGTATGTSWEVCDNCAVRLVAIVSTGAWRKDNSVAKVAS